MRIDLRTDRDFTRVHGLLADRDLHTVCRSAKCPNRHECWNSGTATIMILGDTCTRRCRFCAVTKGTPADLDVDEPARVAAAANEMRLRYVVLTSVTRDDLPDGGAGVFAESIRAVKREIPGSRVEVLVPDFQGLQDSLRSVLEAGPDVFAHNLETVRRLQPVVRPQASYERSLSVLRYAANHRPRVAVKSGLMLGMGESDEEIVEALGDLVKAGCELLTLGQYLAPSRDHHPVARFVTPDEFEECAARARAIGFKSVAAAPRVRSSYKAAELLDAIRRN
jgi:lipoic acid synthetase